MEEKPTSRAHDKTKVIIMPVIHDAEWRFNLFICILFSEELFACSDRAHHITTYDALQWERKISRTPSSNQPTLKRSGRFYKQNTRSFVLLALSSSRSASRVCVCVCEVFVLYAVYAQLLRVQMLYCCCCFCCRFLLTSFSFCIVQIKSGVSLFGCTSVYDFLFYFYFCFRILFCLKHLWFCAPFLLFAVGLDVSFALAAV